MGALTRLPHLVHNENCCSGIDLPPAPQPSCRAPQSIFRVLGSVPEQPAGMLGQERRKNRSIWAGDIRTGRRIISQASLIMSNLRTKGRENVGWGYTNQPGGDQRE